MLGMKKIVEEGISLSLLMAGPIGALTHTLKSGIWGRQWWPV